MSATQAPTSAKRGLAAIIVPIVLMVLSIGGITAAALLSGPANLGAGSLPRGQNSGQMPGGFPTDMPAGMPGGQTGQNGQDDQSGQGGTVRGDISQSSGGQPDFQFSRQAVGVSGGAAVAIAGGAAVFGGSAVFLAMTLINRRKNDQAAAEQASTTSQYVPETPEYAASFVPVVPGQSAPVQSVPNQPMPVPPTTTQPASAQPEALAQSMESVPLTSPAQPEQP